jgi:hypothetical protein
VGKSNLWNLLLYVERNFGQLPLRPAALRRHMSRLHGMIVVWQLGSALDPSSGPWTRWDTML